MKALILAGGRGKRLDNLTSDMNKCMLPFQNIPLIVYSLANSVLANVDEIIIVVGYRAEDIINYVGTLYEGTRVKYVIQKEQKGLVHAIECAQKEINGSDFMTFLGDEILIRPLHKDMMDTFYSSDVFVLCGTTIVNDKKNISKTYSIIQGEDKNIYRLIEKPKNPLNNIMGTGNCTFRNGIFDYIQETPINQKRGEKELPDLIQCAIDDGKTVKSFNIGTEYININTEEDVFVAEKMFLDNMS